MRSPMRRSLSDSRHLPIIRSRSTFLKANTSKDCSFASVRSQGRVQRTQGAGDRGSAASVDARLGIADAPTPQARYRLRVPLSLLASLRLLLRQAALHERLALRTLLARRLLGALAHLVLLRRLGWRRGGIAQRGGLHLAGTRLHRRGVVGRGDGSNDSNKRSEGQGVQGLLHGDLLERVVD